MPTTICSRNSEENYFVKDRCSFALHSHQTILFQGGSFKYVSNLYSWFFIIQICFGLVFQHISARKILIQRETPVTYTYKLEVEMTKNTVQEIVFNEMVANNINIRRGSCCYSSTEKKWNEMINIMIEKNF